MKRRNTKGATSKNPSPRVEKNSIWLAQVRLPDEKLSRARPVVVNRLDGENLRVSVLLAEAPTDSDVVVVSGPCTGLAADAFMVPEGDIPLLRSALLMKLGAVE